MKAPILTPSCGCEPTLYDMSDVRDGDQYKATINSHGHDQVWCARHGWVDANPQATTESETP